MSVGDNIRTARINQGMTQYQLAEMLQQKGAIVGNTTISNWEKGISKPDPDTIEKLCLILNVDANFILGFNKEKNVNTLDELEILYNKTKDILSDSERATVSFVMKNAIEKYEESKKNKEE